MATDPRLARPSWRGRSNVDALTIAAIEAAERRAGFLFEVTQGSYQAGAGDPNSAGTHDRGGVVDLRARGLSATRKRRMVRALREVGFAAWHRTPAQGPWAEHVHAVLIGHPNLAPAAARQVDAYRAGRNGLANNGPDDGPRIRPIPVFNWEEDDMFTDNDRDKLEEALTILRREAKLNHARQLRIVAMRDKLLKGEASVPAVAAMLDELVAEGADQ